MVLGPVAPWSHFEEHRLRKPELPFCNMFLSVKMQRRWLFRKGEGKEQCIPGWIQATDLGETWP